MGDGGGCKRVKLYACLAQGQPPLCPPPCLKAVIYMSGCSCNHSLRLSASISASLVSIDQYLSSRAVISDHNQMHLIADPSLLTCCVPALPSSSHHVFVPVICFVFVSLSIIMFQTLVIALPPRPCISAGHADFLLTAAPHNYITGGRHECACLESA